MSEVASEAVLWYNEDLKLLSPENVEALPGRVNNLIRRLSTMDTLYPHDPNGNPLKKRCTGPCERTLDVTPENFHRNHETKDGFAERCKQCRSEDTKAHYAANKKKIRAYQQDYYKDHKDKIAKINKTYQDKHKEDLKIAKRKYYEDNRDEILSKKAKYRDENREKLKQYFQTPRGIIAKRARTHNRRAQKRNAEGTHTTEELFQQLKRQKNKCYYCKVKLGEGRNNWNADHIAPLSKGGRNDMSNIVIACPPCNMSKRNRLLHEWGDGGRLL